MVDYKCIKLKLSDLPIDSSIRIFSFLKEVLELHNLELKIFKEKLSDFNIGESYFILHYSIKYFDYYDTKSQLRIWIENYERSMKDYDNFQLRKIELQLNSEKVISYCKTNIQSFKKRFKYTLINHPTKYNFPNRLDLDIISEITKRMIRGRKSTRSISLAENNQKSIKIPIILKQKVVDVQNNDTSKSEKRLSYTDSEEVLEKVKDLFSDLMSDLDFAEFKKNTFRHYNSESSFNPLSFLFIDINNKSVLYDRIYSLFLFYRDGIKTTLQKLYLLEIEKNNYKLEAYRSILENSKVDNKKLKKSQVEQLLKAKKIELKSSVELRNRFKFSPTNYTKYDFLCAFYFSFPVIRDSYKKAKLKNKALSLSEYLKIESRNIKTRKKSK